MVLKDSSLVLLISSPESPVGTIWKVYGVQGFRSSIVCLIVLPSKLSVDTEISFLSEYPGSDSRILYESLKIL